MGWQEDADKQEVLKVTPYKDKNGFCHDTPEEASDWNAYLAEEMELHKAPREDYDRQERLVSMLRTERRLTLPLRIARRVLSEARKEVEAANTLLVLAEAEVAKAKAKESIALQTVRSLSREEEYTGKLPSRLSSAFTILLACKKPLQARTIASLTGLDISIVNSRLWELTHKGLISRPDRGWYLTPRPILRAMGEVDPSEE